MFNLFHGSFKIDRKTNDGSMQGIVMFKDRGPRTVLYDEQGWWTRLDGASNYFYKQYMYVLSQSVLYIHKTDGAKPLDILHELHFDQEISKNSNSDSLTFFQSFCATLKEKSSWKEGRTRGKAPIRSSGWVGAWDGNPINFLLRKVNLKLFMGPKASIPLIASHQHQCLDDHYDVKFIIDNNDRFQTIYKVTGPRKNYKISTIYDRL